MKERFQYEIWSLLKRNISKGQLLGYAIANIVGLTVILTGMLFFADSKNTDPDRDKYFSDDYAVLSKRVEGVGFNPVSFSDEDIAKLSKQRWVNKIGHFTSSQFAVSGTVSIGGRGMSSYLFFESVPDDFFDIKPRDWSFDPEERFVPVIINKDYLALYNFGFAIPQGLPQISENVIGGIPIKLRLTGRDNITEYYDAAVVGFSSRLNTIAVPQSFMDWANERYGTDEEKKNPSRLIVKIDRLAAAEMEQYLRSEGIEVAGDREGEGNISEFLGVVSSVVTVNGVVISSLALFILILSIFLLLQKSRDTLNRLMFLGFSPKEIGRYYILVVLVANICITLIATSEALICRQLWAGALHKLGLGGASVVPVLIAAAAYLIFITLINICVIRRKLMAMWHN